MKISLFYEFALPRPWSDDDEHILLNESRVQAVQRLKDESKL